MFRTMEYIGRREYVRLEESATDLDYLVLTRGEIIDGKEHAIAITLYYVFDTQEAKRLCRKIISSIKHAEDRDERRNHHA